MRRRISMFAVCNVVVLGFCFIVASGGGGPRQQLVQDVISTPLAGNPDDAPSGGSNPTPPPAQAEISTNQYDYAPGMNVEISGSAFMTGGNVTLTVLHLSRTCRCGPDTHRSWTVATDTRGTFASSWALAASAACPDVLLLVAIGTDGTRSETLFTTNLTGAIWTTDQCGATVNHNIYGSCAPPNPLVCEPKSPFLNGGPHNHNCGDAGGLPDGDYYFQVTNPGGSVLLSNDSILHRQFHVECGVVTEYANLPGSMASHAVGTGFCPAHDTCPTSISIALWPFDETSNPGGEYKTWVTRVSDYDPSNPQANFGFRESESKTDNYKCGQGACCLPCLEDPQSFFGECRDHITASGCAALGGQFQGEGTVCDGPTCESCPVGCSISCPPDVTVECGDPTDPGSTGTAVCHPNAPLADCESSHSDAFAAGCGNTGMITRTWTCTDTFVDPPLVTSCDQFITIEDTLAPIVNCPPDQGPFNADPGQCCAIVTFEVTAADTCDGSVTPHCDFDSGDCFPVGDTLVTCTATDACDNTSDPCSFHVSVLGSVCGKKFYDANADGIDNDGQVVAGWEIQLKSGGAVIDSTFTAPDGTYCFNVAPGSYTVCEVLPPNPPIGGWYSSTPTCVDVSVSTAECRGEANFGNYCLIISPLPCPVTPLRASESRRL